MSASDWLVGLATIYFLWQQNQIFKRQNEIFASQAGTKMPLEKPATERFERYWPMLAMAFLTITTWVALALDHYGQHRPQTSVAVIVPWTLTLMLAVTVAYLSRRGVGVMASPVFGGPRQYPREVLTVQKVTVDPPTSDPNIIYKNKLRLVLTNATGQDTQIWTPLWEPTEVQQQGYPLGSRFRLLDPKTGDRIRGEDGKAKEYGCLDLRVNSTVDCYIGLLPPTGESIERCLQTNAPMGTAIFPVKIDEKLCEVPIRFGGN